jgi:oxygen-independent coproporphyrinogen III oxidase
MTIAASRTNTDYLIERGRERVSDLRNLQAAGLVCKSGVFFPSVHYPPITMYEPIEETELFDTYTNPADGLFDIYVHIPFCRQRCTFCHYPVQLGEKDDEKDRYLATLDREMELYRQRLGLEKIKARSILVGGGTPTFLTIPQMERFFASLERHVDTSDCTQFNYDVDPVTLIGDEGIARLKLMRAHGVNRVTIGVQSLNPAVLKHMHRHHGIDETLQAIINCKEYGYQVNIEFIFGYPGETLENWAETIDRATKLDVDEIQLYRLKVAAYGDFQGPIGTVAARKGDELPTLEETIMMKQMAIDLLAERGFHENLRRVYTKKREHYSHYAHNQCCMLYDEVGFGLTAFSSLRNRFGLNTQNFDEYYDIVAQGKLPVNRGLVRGSDEQIRWAIILPLKNRTIWKSAFAEQTGVTIDRVFQQKFALLKEFGLIFENENEIGLTKLGAFFADEVAQQFHDPKYIPFPSDCYDEGPLNPYANNTCFG